MVLGTVTILLLLTICAEGLLLVTFGWLARLHNEEAYWRALDDRPEQYDWAQEPDL